MASDESSALLLFIRYSKCMILDARALRNVLTLAEHGNFRRAAAALHLSQPALS
ncbi:MAG: LysR family transcriptional regulator, partial [Calditrichia bacterium]|nr:LysR family transcriptional regulator [Calditrichia bacterium]